MKNLNEILKSNTLVDEVVNGVIIRDYESSDNNGKLDLLLRVLEITIEQKDNLANELKELRERIYGV
ncbi:hypothetical protein SB717_15590 [Priestia sp. SIMBA_032]|uniref:hypothetical protein n=1 Tax=Priestia sp. SIMBA_032 TaxID=3085775 RepID=UPI00397DA682